MKTLFCGALLFLATAAPAIAQPLLQSTAYTRYLLLAWDAAEARNRLGISGLAGTNDLHWRQVDGLLTPIDATTTLITNLISETSTVLNGSLALTGVSLQSLSSGTNIINPGNYTRLVVTGPTANTEDAQIILASGRGFGQKLWIENNNGNGFHMTNGTPIPGQPGVLVLVNGDWHSETAGETLELDQNYAGDWVEQSRINPAAGNTYVFNETTVTNLTVNNTIILKGKRVGTVNPTLGYLPYKDDVDSFGDSPWYRIGATSLGLGSTTQWLYGGNSSVAIGTRAMNNASKPTLAVAIGFEAAENVTAGGSGEFVAIGNRALRSATGNYNGEIAIGSRALELKTAGIGNAAIGPFTFGAALSLSDSTAMGYAAGGGLTNGIQNSLFGSYALYASDFGDNNSLFGFAAGRFTEGVSELAGFGAYALYLNTTGTQLAAFGYRAGYTNTTGAGNTFIGYDANPTAGNLNNVIAIGNGASVTNSNDAVIGNSSNNVIIPGTLESVKALRQYQGSLTHAGTVTLDFNGSHTVSSITLTGSLTVAFSNLAAGRNYRVKIEQPQATNCTLTLPAGTQGYYTATLSNGWHMLSAEAWGTVASNVWVSTSSNGTY